MIYQCNIFDIKLKYLLIILIKYNIWFTDKCSVKFIDFVSYTLDIYNKS